MRNAHSALSVVWQLDAQLGEGPIWIEREQALYFVDIKGGAVHRWHLPSGKGTRFAVGGAPGFVVPSVDGRLLIGSQRGLYMWRPGDTMAPVFEVPDPAGNRINDGTVDETGRLWFGTMDDAERACTGAIWCLDGQRLRRTEAMAIVTNGPAVDDERRALFYVDSVQRTIWKCPLEDNPQLARRQRFLSLAAGDGYPDGIVVDSEGCLWVALWDGWAVRRYSPVGELLCSIRLPCARVTKVAFGGPERKTVFVTTARCGLDPVALASQPLAGSLFAFDSQVPGRAVPEVQR